MPNFVVKFYRIVSFSLKKRKIAIYVISILRLQIRKNARKFSEYFNIVFKTVQFP